LIRIGNTGRCFSMFQTLIPLPIAPIMCYFQNETMVDGVNRLLGYNDIEICFSAWERYEKRLGNI